MFGHWTPLQVTDLPVAVLFILALSSIGVYGIVLAGWSSGSTYPLLGGVRSTAQVISYEVAMGLSFATVFLFAGTMSTSQIVAAQNRVWYVFLLLPSFTIYLCPWSARPTGRRSTCPRPKANWLPVSTPSTRR